MNSDFNDIRKINFRIIIILLVVIIIGMLIFVWIYFFNNEAKQYSIEVKDLYIMYVDKELSIPVKINGNKGNTNDVVTKFKTESNEIIELDNEEFLEGKGHILVKSLSPGRDHINLTSYTIADLKVNVLDTKTIDVVVCPKLEEGLLSTKTINIRIGEGHNLGIKSEEECLKLLRYKSNDVNIATVDKNGNIAGVNKGNTTIKISNGVSKVIVNINVT